MALENLPRILMLQDSRGGTGGLEQQVDADGEVRAVHETRTALFDQLAYLIEIAVPAGGPNHHVFARADAGLNVSQDSLRGGEVNHDIHITQFLRGERRSMG